MTSPVGGDRRLDDAVDGLRDPDKNVRQAAALHLGTAADERAAVAVVARLGVEPDFFVRDTLSWTATRLAAATTPLLLRTIADGVPVARVQALHVLSKIADPATAEEILPLVTDEDPDVAAKARWALGRIGDPRGIAALTALLGGEDGCERNGLTRDLAEFGPDAAPALAHSLGDSNVAVRRHAAEILCFLGPDAEGETCALAEALADADDEVRLSAAMALHDLRTAAALKVLERHQESEHAGVRTIARRALKVG